MSLVASIAGIGSGVTATNLVERDHRASKRRVKASQHFRSFWVPGEPWPVTMTANASRWKYCRAE